MQKRFLTFLLALVFIVGGATPVNASTISKGQTTTYTITEAYSYPVTPKTEEWEAMSLAERVQACLVDETVAARMTTQALLGTVVDFPYIINIAAYNSIAEGIHIVRGYFSPLDGLLNRCDASLVIAEYIDKCKANGDISDVEYVISTQYHVACDLYNYLSAVLDDSSGTEDTDGSNSIRYFIDPITGWIIDTVRTPNNSKVYVFYGLTWQDHSNVYGQNITYNNVYSYDVQLQSMFHATMLRNPDPSYNCHSFAWHSTSSSNPYWMDDPSKYMQDGSYVQMNMAAPGYKVTYHTTDNSNTTKLDHSGIVSSVNGSFVQVISKWGFHSLFSHSLHDCPYVADALAYGYCVSAEFWN